MSFPKISKIFGSGEQNSSRTIDGMYMEREFRLLIERERERADRNNHRFSLLVIELREQDASRTAMRQLIRSVLRRIRNIDEFGWYDNHRIGILLPYTTETGARELAEKIISATIPSMPRPVCVVYTYPSSGKMARHQPTS